MVVDIPRKLLALVNPFTGKPIESARFRVEGHDHAQFIEPPILAELPPLMFYDKSSAAELVTSLRAKLEARAQELALFNKTLRARGMSANIDSERGVVVVRVELEAGMGTAVIEGDTQEMVAVDLLPAEGPTKRPPIALGRTPIDFASLADRIDLEIHLAAIAEAAIAKGPAKSPKPEKKGFLADTGQFELSIATGDVQFNTGNVPKMKAAPEPAAEKSPAAPVKVTVRPSGARLQERKADSPVSSPLAPGSLSLKLLADKIGPSALLGAGVAVERELSIGGRRIRFQAKHREGLKFIGRLFADDEELWTEEFSLDGFPGVLPFARLLLGMGPEEATGEERGPQPGDIWMMRVVIEREEGDEIRYVALDTDGQPYGAARILPSAAFSSAFQTHAGGFRLAIRVLAVDGERVTYVRLDKDSVPVDRPKAIPTASFLTQFVREGTG